jgi:Glycosyltransferase family 87
MELSDGLATHERGVWRAAKSSPTLLVIAAGIIAAVLKIYCAATTFGSCDVPVFSHFGQIIDADGIDYLYQTNRRFNFPPITGEFFGLLYHLSAWLTPGAPDSVPRSFPFLLRLPSIVADFVALLVLLRIREKTRRAPVWVLLLFALSPVSFMVSGFHGNVDPVMLCLLLIAVYFCVQEHALLNGAFFALACSIKVAQLFLTPVFFFFWLNRGSKRALQFTLAFGISCLAGWSGALSDSASFFIRNVLGYNSYPGGWGITYWCTFLLDEFHFDVTPQGLNWLIPLLKALKIVIVALAIALGWFRRRQSTMGFLDTIGLCWICFAIFTPGFVPYYLVWMAPFVLLYSATWYAALTAASSIYLFAYYNMMSHGIMPWNASDPLVPPAWNDWGTVPWFVMVAIAVGALIRKWPLRTKTGNCGLRRSASPQVA